MGEVLLTLEGLPAGITATLDKLPANGSETTLKLVATEKAPTGTNTLTVAGAGLHHDRNYKRKTGTIELMVGAPDRIELATNAPPTAVTGAK